MTGSSILAAVEEDLKGEFQRAHVKAHAIQFAGLFLSAFLTSVAVGGFHVAGWAALAGLAVGAAGAAARQMWPQIPWPLVLSVLHAGQQQPTPPPTSPTAPPHG
jgi:hypothetical protein